MSRFKDLQKNLFGGTTSNVRQFGMIFALVAIVALFQWRTDGLTLQPGNLINVVSQYSYILILAMGMLMVIVAGHIDLSVGSVAGLSSVCAALAISATGNALFGVLAGLAVGLVVGIVNGSLVTFLGMPSFLVTLAMLGIAFGLAQFITKSAPVPILDETFNAIFGGGNLGPIPGLLLWTIVAVAVGWVVLNKTRFGRQVLATGGNRVAAEYSGVNTRRITFTVMLVSSVVAAIAGMLYAGRLESGRYQWGTGDELSVIAAVILGGTSLFGGAGNVIGALFGSLMIGLINNGLILAGFDNSQQQIIRGLIIIVAVALARRK